MGKYSQRGENETDNQICNAKQKIKMIFCFLLIN